LCIQYHSHLINYVSIQPLVLCGRAADALTSSFHSQRSGGAANRRRESLAECVSSYGMVCDAFSVGTTIRHSITGVPPDKDVEEFIAFI